MSLIASQFFLYFFIISPFSYGANTLVVNQSLSGNQTLVSLAGNFEMGFFNPGKSPSYYIGIWFKKIQTRTIVWVANRETPVSDIFSSKLKIIDGNLVLLDDSNTQIWSTNIISSTIIPGTVVVLLDDGNLVLRYRSTSGPPIWQSFDHPTHTMLPGSKLGYNKRTDTKQVLTSWRNSEDPAVGLFSFETDENSTQILIKWNSSIQYWTSGSWDDQNHLFRLIPEMKLNSFYNISYVDNENESYFSYSLYNPSIISRFIIDVTGQFKQMYWLDTTGQWNEFWAQPLNICEVYGSCGSFGVCNLESLPACSCLTDFEPRSQSDWDLGSFSGGCVRKTILDCTDKTRKPVFILSYVEKRFLSALPENEVPSVNEPECRSSCLDNCSCNAYTFISNICHHWNLENFTSLLLTSNGSNRDTIYVKVSSFDQPQNNTKVPSDHHKINTKVIVTGDHKLVLIALPFFLSLTFWFSISGIVSGCLGLVFLGSIIVIFYRRMKSQDRGVLSEEDRKSLDVPFFEFKRISSATENFSLANKLGQGGFGPVYKGTFPGGAELAVKRLSSQSGQGLKEFKNEVSLIAKLQHRNLIRLLGYGMKNHEMILLYEYMPNKSLDRFIFDRTLCMRLDWLLRLDIIIGIARGLLYLHQDSRLRVIHRDLKASNVLLDGDMDPKISDFGLAKIVKGRDIDGSLTRVVGTFGYMAPEYALNGFFSVKSDVFSFGVVVLEIISGKRNTSCYDNKEAFSLISYAWGLWKAKKPLDLLDPTLVESSNSIEVSRCMIIGGLLCVQEDPQDRPTMKGVLGMLGMDIESLPDPKEPAFISKKHVHSSPSYVSESDMNQLTITEEAGR
ncbi:hypothetical protein SSX86_032686 [Deinandra increscens subsp. villosa]|uniref:Receptor-like serine/threonine-protein kinase n=1 Tax=Deinandra increscens subsp. villosa TaxID=3103831 RepID=A0AAP0C3U2_9ASTR